MGNVTLYSVQNKAVLEDILNGTYKPSFGKSLGRYDYVSYMAYKYMNSALSAKTHRSYIDGIDTCIWAWYKNPYFENQLGLGSKLDDLVVIEFVIDSNEVVFSNFDIWNEMYLSEDFNSSIVNIDDIGKDMCVQAVVWGIPRSSIVSICSLRDKICRS